MSNDPREAAAPDAPSDESEDGSGIRRETDRRIVTQPYDFSVRTLVDQIADSSLVVQDVYQRYFVWDASRSSRLIESLLLNIPIPVCYFAELDDGKQTVVDGHQRLQSIFNFCKDKLTLRGLRVLVEHNGKRLRDLDPKTTRMLNSRTLRCIVITRESDPDIRFDVFERLNTGAIGLNAQELRNCVYRGDLNDFLRRKVSEAKWLTLSGQSERDDRMRDCELILRFLALSDGLEDYTSPMKRFLNRYMMRNTNPSETDLGRIELLVQDVLTKVEMVFGTCAFRSWTGSEWEKNTNKAVFDTQMLTLSSIQEEEVTAQASAILETFKYVSSSSEFRESTTLGTGDRSKLIRRLTQFSSALKDAGLHPRLAERLDGMSE
jgi:hypothetical protein